MTVLLPFSEAVDIGHGRGRLAAPAAASLARIDAQLGRPADVNEAWRSPAQADANYAKWVAYRDGYGPIAPYALPASESIHCRGYAVDSDDWYSAAAAVWRDNGWVQTARYPGTNRDEPWHGEYVYSLDNHRNASAGSGSIPFPANRPERNPDMPVFIEPTTISWPNGYTNTYDRNVFLICQWVANREMTDPKGVEIYVNEAWHAAREMDRILKEDDAPVAVSKISKDEIATLVAERLAG